MEEGTILINYLGIIYKRRKHILIPTILVVIATGIISFLLPPQWEVDCVIFIKQVLPSSKINNPGKFSLMNPAQIAKEINAGYYNYKISKDLNIPFERLPKVEAQNIKNTPLVRISLQAYNVNLAEVILSKIIYLIKEDANNKVSSEIGKIESNIKKLNIDIEKIEDRIRLLRKKYKIIEKREEELKEEINKIEEIIKDSKTGNKFKKPSKNNSITEMLEYDEIQAQLNSLKESLISNNITKEEIYYNIEKYKKDIQKINVQIEELNNKKKEYNCIQIVKEPTPSLYPVSPKRGLNILISIILSAMGFTMLAFFLEHIERVKNLHKSI